MGKQIPLVIYRRGVRTVLGMVSIEEDGSLAGQVAKDQWPLVKELFAPNVGEFSINPAPTRPMTDYTEPSRKLTKLDPI